jgi:hypothetical protein
MKKRIVSLLLVVLLLTVSAVPALAAAPKIKKVEYDGNGVVDVDFTTKNVRYKNAKVVVKDSAGKKLTAKIIEKDTDEISFKVTGVKAGKKYTFTISGVRAGKSGSYGTVKGSFSTPSGKPRIVKVAFNPDYDDLEIDFATDVEYKNLKITVRDADGNKLLIYNIEKDPDNLDMDVEGMVVGKTYTITVSGVRVKGVGSYTSVSKTFVA